MGVTTLPNPVFALERHVERYKGCVGPGVCEDFVKRLPNLTVVGEVG